MNKVFAILRNMKKIQVLSRSELRIVTIESCFLGIEHVTKANLLNLSRA